MNPQSPAPLLALSPLNDAIVDAALFSQADEDTGMLIDFMGMGTSDRLSEARRIMRAALLTAYNELLAEKGWLAIESAPYETDVWLFDAEQEPSQFVGRLTEGHDGPYWRPAEQLVADVMAEYMHPTHWQPLPPTPGSEAQT